MQPAVWADECLRTKRLSPREVFKATLLATGSKDQAETAAVKRDLMDEYMKKLAQQDAISGR